MGDKIPNAYTQAAILAFDKAKKARYEARIKEAELSVMMMTYPDIEMDIYVERTTQIGEGWEKKWSSHPKVVKAKMLLEKLYSQAGRRDGVKTGGQG